ncbi:MAG: type I glyceraldehyde-3-phosphate dehydrogenase [Planctomycetota bacterium]|nr:MAG: type I glyceraldehyde-3-phosphate dehydrogenase [Planctomycetota bacterium]
MTLRIGINGFGRIGRLVFRIMQERRDEFEVVAISHYAADARALAHLAKYDSVFGKFKGTIEATEDAIIANGRKTRVITEKDLTKIPWKQLEIDCVVESTGVVREREGIQKHLDAGAKRVLLTFAPKDDPDAMVVLGVNDEVLKPEHKIISNASCTTNCLAPMVKVLNDEFGVEEGLMTTVHAVTNDQRVTDRRHKDPRRARAASQNIIPTTTGAARAVGKVIPELNGKLNGLALRVPVICGSIADFVAVTKKPVDVDSVNNAFKSASESGRLKDILEYCDEPIVSSDILGNTHSCIYDSLATITMGKNMVKVLGWYDNEWGYSCRVCDLIAKAGAL